MKPQGKYSSIHNKSHREQTLYSRPRFEGFLIRFEKARKVDEPAGKKHGTSAIRPYFALYVLFIVSKKNDFFLFVAGNHSIWAKYVIGLLYGLLGENNCPDFSIFVFLY